MTSQEFNLIRSFSGSAIMVFLAALSFMTWMETDWVFYLLLAIRDLYLVFFFIKRHEPFVVSGFQQKILAYTSSALPLLYQSGFATTGTVKTATFLFVMGFTLSTLALIDLGYSFGVSPSVRKPVRSGLYRFINHPMYIGYCIAEVGMVLIAPIPNSIIFFFSIILYIARAKAESNLIKRHTNENFN